MLKQVQRRSVMTTPLSVSEDAHQRLANTMLSAMTSSAPIQCGGCPSQPDADFS